MRIELTDEQSARVIAAFIDRFLVPNEACGSPAIPQPDLSPELRDILTDLMSRQSGIFATLSEVQSSVSFLGDRQIEGLGQLAQFQFQLQRFKEDIMASFQELIDGQKTNNGLVIEALVGVQGLLSRQDALLEGKPTAAQLQELRSLQETQKATLAQVIDTVKQSDVTTPSPTEPTPAEPPAESPVDGGETAPDAGSGDAPVGGDAAPSEPPVDAAPVEVPATPDPIVVAPAPDEIGLPGSVEIDAPAPDASASVDSAPVDSATDVGSNPNAPSPLF